LCDHLLPALHSLSLSLELFLLILALLPLLVGDASHDTLVCLGLTLALLEVTLFLVVVLLLDLLILLLQKTLLQPFLEKAIGCLSLGLFLEPFELLLSPLLMLFAFLLMSLTLLPVSKSSKLFLPSYFLFGLDPSHLLKDVNFGLLDQIFFELDLVLFAAAPLFMRESVFCAISDL